MAQNPLNPVLTRFARERSMGAGGVGAQLFPLLASETGLNGEYAVYPRMRGVEEVDPTRGRGQDVKIIGIEDYTTAAYRLVDRTIDAQVPIEDTIVPANLNGNAQLLNKFDRGAAKAQRVIMTEHERNVYDQVWGANKAAFEAIYTAAHVADAIGKWDATSGRIKTDVELGKTRVYNSTGYMPNTLLMPNLVWNKVIGADNELRDTLKYTQSGGQTLQYLSTYLGLNVIVPQFLVDNNNSGQAENFAQLWDNIDNVGLFYIDPNPTNLSDTLGLTFYHDTAETPFMGVEPYWNQTKKSWMARCGAYYDTKMVDNLCGYIINDVLT